MVLRRTLILIAAMLATSCSGSTTAPSSPTPAAPLPPSVTVTPAPNVVVTPTPRPTGFDLAFWNQFAHGTRDNASPVALSRLTSAPTIYLRTLDDDGAGVDPVTMSTVENAMRDVASTWTGGRFGLAAIVRENTRHDGQAGTLTVHWSSTAVLGNLCGRSNIGLDGGTIQLNYHAGFTGCGCNGSAISPHVAKHELGHAFGYWHTSSVDDLMDPTTASCDANPSARERLHATYAYSQPNGSID